MTQTLHLQIQAEDATDEDVADFTREINKSISMAVQECKVVTPSGNATEGEKGIKEIFGSLNILFDKLDVLNVVAQCLTTYIKERRKTVSVTVTNDMGDSVSFSAENLGKAELHDLVTQLRGLTSVGSNAP